MRNLRRIRASGMLTPRGFLRGVEHPLMRSDLRLGDFNRSHRGCSLRVVFSEEWSIP